MSPRPKRPIKPVKPIKGKPGKPVKPIITTSIWFHPHNLHPDFYELLNSAIEVYYTIGGTLCKVKELTASGIQKFSVQMGLPLPPEAEITSLSLTYKCSNARSYIEGLRLLDLQKKQINGGTIFIEEIPLKSTTVKEYTGSLDTYKVQGGLSIHLALHFANKADEIRIGPIGIRIIEK